MTLFTLGPVEMYPRTLEVASRQVPYFRTSEFSEIVLENERLIKKFSYAQDSSKVVFLTASGTAAMEASVMNCFSAADKLLVIDGGSFGHRFAQICSIHQIPHEVIHIPFGQALTEGDLTPFEGKGFTGFLVNIHETSTGQLYDARMLAEFCRRNDLLFVVDAISSFLADDLSMEALGIDVLIFSSQKALALAPGLSIVVLSDRIYESRVRGSVSPTMYFDFENHVVNGVRGQTPFTPAVQILIELNDRLRTIDTKGVEVEVARMRELAADFRSKVSRLPIELPAYPLSNATTPLIFSGIDAHEVFEILRAEYDMTLTPNGGELASRVLRVGHLGNHTTTENAHLVEALGTVLTDTRLQH